MSAQPSPARRVAADVLCRVIDDDAYAAAALDAALVRENQLDPRDRALATELVYGVLRTETALVARLRALSDRGRDELVTRARAHLLMGAYALLFLDRVPVFAAVSEAASGAREVSGPGAAGFVNAVLRRLAKEVEGGARPSLAEVVAQSTPGWLRRALARSLGKEGAGAFLAAGPVPPPLGICVTQSASRQAIMEQVQGACPGAELQASAFSPRLFTARGAGDIRGLRGYEREWIVQEEGAALVAELVGARAGEVLLDACAGRGNKVFSLRDAVGPGGAVDAADLYAKKLDVLAHGPRSTWARARYQVDWSEGTVHAPRGYDRVLVDAPCSGIGTLRRRPEIARRRHGADVGSLSALQVAITRRAATRVRDGGRLIYAVCSVLREEAEDVVHALTAEPIDDEGTQVELSELPFDAVVSDKLLGAPASTVRLLPHVQGTDGYFVASLLIKRRGQ